MKAILRINALRVLSPSRHFLLLCAVLFLNLLIVNAQSGDSITQPVENMQDELKPGRLLSQGANNNPVGALGVLTYRLEEIKAARVIQAKNKQVSLTGFRLIITTAEPLAGASYLIWIDDTSYQAITLGLNRVAVELETSELPDGARLAVSPLIREDSDVSTQLSVLPELLAVPSLYGRAIPGEKNRYSLKKKSKFIKSLDKTVSGVEIEMPGDNGYVLGAKRWVVQIGDKEYYAAVRNNTLTVWLSDEEFAELREGDRIKVKYGSGPSSAGESIGQLKKGSIQE